MPGPVLSGLPIVQTTADIHDPVDFMYELLGALTSAGWGHTSIAGAPPGQLGWEFQCWSPQSLSMRLRVWYPNLNNDLRGHVFFQGVSPVNSAETTIYYLGVNNRAPSDPWPLRRWGIWANCCSLFLGEYQTQNSFYARSFQCGIPYSYMVVSATPDCSNPMPMVFPDTVDEFWWVSGCHLANEPPGYSPFLGHDFRTNHFCQRASVTIGLGGIPGIRETVELKTEVADSPSAWQIFLFRPAKSEGSGGSGSGVHRGFPNGIVYHDRNPAVYSPGIGGKGIIYGVLYDAVMISRRVDLLDEEVYLQYGRFVSYSRNDTGDWGWVGTLCLATGSPSIPGNPNEVENFVY